MKLRVMFVKYNVNISAHFNCLVNIHTNKVRFQENNDSRD